MTACSSDYAVHYRWEWFRRGLWRSSFRERKRHSTGAFIELAQERGLLDQPVLDSSCGMGLKTILMREAGLTVHGSDICPEAIELARQLAVEEGHANIPYFVSSWAELPRTTDTRYAAIFNDVLSWVYSEEEMAASLKGLHDCLVPGGLFTYMGALPGTEVDARAQILEQEWAKHTSQGRHGLGVSATDGKVSMQEVVFLEKGPDFIDKHHLYLVEEAGARRLESWCLRMGLRWGWRQIEPFLRRAGFTTFGTKQFIAANGKPAHLVVAGRE